MKRLNKPIRIEPTPEELKNLKAVFPEAFLGTEKEESFDILYFMNNLGQDFLAFAKEDEVVLGYELITAEEFVELVAGKEELKMWNNLVHILPENYWDIVCEHLPKHSDRSDVLESDILQKYVDGELEDKEDIEWVESTNATKEEAIATLNKLNFALYQEALQAKNSTK